MSGYYTQEGGSVIDTLNIPEDVLCIVRAVEGVVWMRDSHPRMQWLADAELDAWAATVEDHTYGRPDRTAPGVSG